MFSLRYARRYPRLLKYSRRLAYTGAGVGTLWALDNRYNASAVTRSLRTLWVCALITADYKLNFTPEKSDQIPELHTRVGERVYDLLTRNGGLYIKIGQAIGANAALLPPPIQAKFAKLFDDAPQIPYEQVLKVFQREFGRPPDGPNGVFKFFDTEAIASASIAQVHKAQTHSGEWVAVKVQKPDVARQTAYDLFAYKCVMRLFDWQFEMPVYFLADFISDHLRQELNFHIEANNASTMAQFVASDPYFASSVYIPKVYNDLTTQRIMTAEWIDGVRMSDRQGILRLMGEAKSGNVPKPLKGGTKTIMQIMVELFSAQMFSWGWVHCDPHPGNILIRPSPQSPRKPQLVLLDHGLYVRMKDDFRLQYASLWRKLISGDFEGVQSITKEWGVGQGSGTEIFASATLMKPTRLRKSKSSESKPQLSQYEKSQIMKARLKTFLTDTDRLPKELVFLGRNMRIVQGNNMMLGSPVNRIKITGYWASKSLISPGAAKQSLISRIAAFSPREFFRHLVFEVVMLATDFAFWYSQLKKRFGLGAGFEDDLEQQMRGFARDELGLEIQGAFDG